ncbi:MAG: hypothetical protein QXD43_01015 [Candidatus Aenigmatarchaeota archaeon]
MITKRLINKYIFIISLIILGTGSGILLSFILIRQLNIVLPRPLQPTTSFITISTSSIEQLLQDNKYFDAYTMALQYLHQHSDSLNAYLYLGNTLFLLNNYEESNKVYQEALNKLILTQEEKSDIYYLIGINYQFLNYPASALDYFQNAINLNPSNYKPYLATGQILLKQKKITESLTYVQKANSLLSNDNPQKAYCYYYLAQIYLQLKDYQAAKIMISQALNLSNNLNANLVPSFIDSIQNLNTQINAALSP